MTECTLNALAFLFFIPVARTSYIICIGQTGYKCASTKKKFNKSCKTGPRVGTSYCKVKDLEVKACQQYEKSKSG